MASPKDPIPGTEHTVAAPEATPSASVLDPDGADGTVLGGRYEIIGLLGAGGMGSVYRAHDRELDETVALKMLSRELVATPGMLDRFRQEVKLARRVTHVNVARTFDIGEHDGERFLTMELVVGESLGQLLQREGALPLGRIVEIAIQVCTGLGAAHAAQVIHRDLKPDNVVVAKDGRVVLTDFGIARAFDGSGAMTQGLPIGTPSYMAPEQVEGTSAIDARTDVYALGTMLFEMVTGSRAWSGQTPLAVAVARLTHPPPDPRLLRTDLPDALADVILRCMQRQPSDRYERTDEVIAALRALDVSSDVYSAPMSMSTKPARSKDETAVGDKTVAVLPFRNLGPADDDYLAEGLADDILDTLSMRPGLRVRSRGAVADFKGKRALAQQIGRELRVHVVVEGSLRRVGTQIRVSVRIVSVADGFQLWAQRFDRPMGDVLLVGDEAATAIAAALTVSKRNTMPVRGREAGEVIDLYLRARHEYHKFWGDSNSRAIALFEEARALAPDHPRVLGGYALALMRRFQVEAGHENAADEATFVAHQALAVDASNAEARVALAGIAWALGDAVTAAREILAALHENPRLGDARDLGGRLLIEIGAIDAGIAQLQGASEAEPGMRPHTIVDIARGLALQGRWSDALASLEKPPTSDPSALNTYWLMRARLVAWTRDKDMAQRLLTDLAIAPDFLAKTMALGILATTVTGQVPHEAMKFLEARSDGNPKAMKRRAFRAQIQAEVAGRLGDIPGGLRALTAADEAHLLDVAWLEHCDVLADLRGEETYRSVLERTRARAKEVELVFALAGRDGGDSLLDFRRA